MMTESKPARGNIMTKYRRASGFTEEIGERICELLCQGHSVLGIARMRGMPSGTTIRRWGWNARLSSESFVADYARAREEGAHVAFDKLLGLAQELLDGKDIDPAAARVAIDTIKWCLSKQLPSIYGDRQTIAHEGEVKMKALDHCPEWLQEAIHEAHSSAAQQEDDEPATH
jgi:hypothetical protein